MLWAKAGILSLNRQAKRIKEINEELTNELRRIEMGLSDYQSEVIHNTYMTKAHNGQDKSAHSGCFTSNKSYSDAALEEINLLKEKNDFNDGQEFFLYKLKKAVRGNKDPLEVIEALALFMEHEAKELGVWDESQG